jgi:phenylacetate-CoA ligase
MTPADPCVLDRDAITSHQLEQLRALLPALLATNRFYAAKLHDIEPRPSGSGVFNLTDFVRCVPFTFKSELIEDQAKNPPYGSNLTDELVRYSRFSQTSGTTGVPMRWLDTPESWSWMVDCWTRVFRSAGVTPEDRVFFPFSFGPFLGFWVAFDAATRMGCLAIPGGGMRSSWRLQVLLDNQVTVLCCTPTYAVRLAEVAAQEGIDLNAGKVRRIIVAGEPGGSIPATRALIEKLWPGARVADHHGMTETGPVSYECPERLGILHIMELAYFPEVLETGELVLTNLGRTSSPLLRYRTGDIVRPASEPQCRCGSYELAIEGGILGRADDMVVVRGVNLYPTAVEEVVRGCGVAEFRVEMNRDRALTEMSIQIELSLADDAEALRRRVAEALQNAFALRVAVSCVPYGTLPRFEGKAKRWVTMK